YLIDVFAVDPSPLWEHLADKELVIHNAAFDLAFLTRLGLVPGTVHDTMLLAQLLAAGTSERVTLAACCQRCLDRTLDKTERLGAPRRRSAGEWPAAGRGRGPCRRSCHRRAGAGRA